MRKTQFASDATGCIELPKTRLLAGLYLRFEAGLAQDIHE